MAGVPWSPSCKGKGTSGHDAKILRTKNQTPGVWLPWPSCHKNVAPLLSECFGRRPQPGASLLSTQARPALSACLLYVTRSLVAKRFTGNEPKPRSKRNEAGSGAVSGLLLAARLSGPGDSAHTSPQTKQPPIDRSTSGD